MIANEFFEQGDLEKIQLKITPMVCNFIAFFNYLLCYRIKCWFFLNLKETKASDIHILNFSFEELLSENVIVTYHFKYKSTKNTAFDCNIYKSLKYKIYTLLTL